MYIYEKNGKICLTFKTADRAAEVVDLSLGATPSKVVLSVGDNEISGSRALNSLIVGSKFSRIIANTEKEDELKTFLATLAYESDEETGCGTCILLQTDGIPAIIALKAENVYCLGILSADNNFISIYATEAVAEQGITEGWNADLITNRILSLSTSAIITEILPAFGSINGIIIGG